MKYYTITKTRTPLPLMSTTPDSRIPVVLLCVTFGRNKPDFSLYEESKIPISILNRIRTVKTDNYFEVCYDDPDDEASCAILDKAFEKADLYVDITNGIPDIYKVVTAATYLCG